MTEQPSIEALSLATEFERGDIEERNRLARRIDALCEQRVSAERERCFAWALGRVPRSRACGAIRDGDDPHAVHVPKDPSLCWRCGETLRPGHYCAPAEHPPKVKP